MQAFIVEIIKNASFIIGLVGIFIILWGAIFGFWNFFKSAKSNFSASRLILSRHLVLGLDFLVAKDIISTFLMEGRETWIDLAQLLVVVGVRITLNHFLEKEIEILKAPKK